MLVEIDAELLGAVPELVTVHGGGKRRLLELLLDRLRGHPDEPLRPDVGDGEHEPGQLVHGEQGLLHRGLAGNAHEVGVGRDGAHELRRIATRLEFADRVPGVTVREIRIALVVKIVHQSGQSPQLDIPVKPGRVGPHRGLDGEHVAAQRVGFRPLAKEGPGVLARNRCRHGCYPS